MPFLKCANSERNFQEWSCEVVVAQCRQSLLTGFRVVILPCRTISKLWIMTSGSVTVRSNWPDSRAPELWDGVPCNINGGDSISTESCAGCDGPSLGDGFGLALILPPDDVELPVKAAPRDLRLSFEVRRSMVPRDVGRPAKSVQSA